MQSRLAAHSTVATPNVSDILDFMVLVSTVHNRIRNSEWIEWRRKNESKIGHYHISIFEGELATIRVGQATLQKITFDALFSFSWMRKIEEINQLMEHFIFIEYCFLSPFTKRSRCLSWIFHTVSYNKYATREMSISFYRQLSVYIMQTTKQN